MKRIFNNQKGMTFLLILAVFLSCMGSQAQTISYSYDGSGNFTSGSIISENSMLKSSSEKSEDSSDQNEPPKSEAKDLLLLPEGKSISIFPNPNKGQFQVELKGFDDELKKGMISIFSAQGQAILKLSPLQLINSININNQPVGSYVMLIAIGSNTITHKVIVER